MAYENGYEAIAYIGDCIEKYSKDPLMFTKAAQVIPVFLTRSDWPYSCHELDHSIHCLLGDTLSGLIWFTDKYLYDERIIWPEQLPDRFKEQLESFHIAVSPIVAQFWSGSTKPMRLFNISRTTNFKNNSFVRFIRMDGAKLDLELDRHDIEKMINTLHECLKEQGENNG